MKDMIGYPNLKSLYSVMLCLYQESLLSFGTDFISYPLSVLDRATRDMSSRIARSRISSKAEPELSE